MSRANDLERQMLDLINEERTSRGLDPVELELRLNESSEDHSQWMLEEDRFSHTGENGSSPGDRMRDAEFAFEGNWTWGENIAYQSERGAPGLADDVENLHDALMNSPGHRANILNPDYEVVGLGIETGDFGGFDAVMVTQNFAATDAELQIDDDAGPSEPDPDAPIGPVADTPDPEPDTPEPDEPDPVTPEPDLPEPDEPEPDTPGPDLPDTDGPVADDPTPDEPVPPVPDTPEEPETPGGGSNPFAQLDDETVTQLQFFVSGFFATLFDEDFTFTYAGGEGDEPQTATFDIDELFESLFSGPGGDGDTETDEEGVALASDGDAGDDAGFQFIETWDCLA